MAAQKGRLKSLWGNNGTQCDVSKLRSLQTHTSCVLCRWSWIRLFLFKLYAVGCFKFLWHFTCWGGDEDRCTFK